ncbi:MAG: hypothetical protein DSM107014_16695 [Gomphosphaeria aponina SAG 52.96 = DSM 107014]|uniref:Inhibitor of g-type lysozyme n=1 Tax=Gomphosphaeria aponina SAG 52.96 = DSM 107014 TaxID=1521640 RepID=A0A941GTF9_9CHRO|nr:hypothetical protein [Gomphosphaeria aponina SAG 52.96 = DSM 107014]
MIYKSLALATLSLLFTTVPTISTLAQDEIRQENVQFKPDTTGTTIQGEIKGDETVDYILRANAGQSMVVILSTDNLANYFNVIAPGEDSAMFIGSTEGNRFEGNLPKDGDYTIRVYLMRSAAREEETANYSMEIGIANNNPTAPYTTETYDATTSFKCEVRDSADGAPVTHSQDCPAGILRGDPGSASMRIMLPNGVERVLNFEAENVTTPDGGELTWGKEENGDWYIGIDNQEFYIIPEAAIYGD